jgi:hypothetical protein
MNMTTFFTSRLGSAILALSLIAPAAAMAQSSATVVVNGQPMQFDQPPVEQNGRLFVPLRGVFEHLGASVVYSNGQINATAGRTTVQLQVGSTQATVNGQPTTLDAPPFLVGGRLLVPLRFISQALGASVNFVSSSDTVYVNQSGNQDRSRSYGYQGAKRGEQNPAPPRADEGQPDVVTMGLAQLQPQPGAMIGAHRPEISARFQQPVDPDTVRIALDGRDVTPMANVTDHGFVLTPSFDLAPGKHTVTLAGRIDHGPRFDGRWDFLTQPG